MYVQQAILLRLTHIVHILWVGEADVQVAQIPGAATELVRVLAAGFNHTLAVRAPALTHNHSTLLLYQLVESYGVVVPVVRLYVGDHGREREREKLVTHCTYV